MTLKLAIATFVGAFIFPFLIRLLWGKMVENWGAIGGWMAAGFIVGTTWLLNHGIGMINQSGKAWIDMAWAAGTGLIAASVYSGDKFKKAIPTIACAVVGGVFAGFMLSLFL
ncbi:Lin0368 family putative glycerol transporter subunit [Fonticella tunisiensis]|uniref:Uncharacterized protein n=1 Tax=Fonticella tunisiensis TaxID=1096341 RepID=A0A4R7K8M3_9CLOT|nr:hypothetical protein [Fonticella tunisiensis]TDT50347.1 hypothetical protein EDD71_1307 [Fonticella tunisiensis]